MLFNIKKLIFIFVVYLSAATSAQMIQTPGSAYKHFCENINNYPPFHMETVKSITMFTQERDCTKAAEKLALLEEINIPTMITTFFPFSDLTKLKRIHLLGNFAIDLNQLQNLKLLNSLQIANFSKSYMPPVDLSPLLELPNLTNLDLTGIQALDPTVIGELTSLRGLVIDGLKGIKSLNFISNLKELRSFSYECSDLFDQSELNSLIKNPQDILNLELPDCYSSELEDISALSNFTYLTYLNLNFQFINNISSLKTLTKLEGLQLKLVPVKDFSPIKDLKLKQLSIGKISRIGSRSGWRRFQSGLYSERDLSPVFNIKTLKVLDLSGNGYYEIKGVNKLKELISLDISSDVFGEDLNYLSGLNKLESLSAIAKLPTGEEYSDGSSINWTFLTDISVLREFTNLKELYLRGHSVKNISPLSNLTKLKHLSLSNNLISDISPLTNLKKLKMLDISRSAIPKSESIPAITNIMPLVNLTRLEELTLNYQDISNITPLMPLANLKTLSLDGNNKINNIEALKYMQNLRIFSFSCVKVFSPEIGFSSEIINQNMTKCDKPILTDLSPLKDLVWLLSINLSFNNIEDITPLKNLRYLRDLRINGNKINDISTLENLQYLKVLDLSENNVIDITAIEKLENLTSLDASTNPISKWINFKLNPYLTSINLSSTNLSSLKILEDLSFLQLLSINDNEITDFSPIANFVTLRTLSANKNKISDLIDLNKLSQLEVLQLSENDISDITQLNIPSLKFLNLSKNNISSIESLAKLRNLSLLYLDNNNVRDIMPLYKLPLTSVNLSNNVIEEIGPLSESIIIWTLGLSGNPIKNIASLSSLENLSNLTLSNTLVTNYDVLHMLPELSDLDVSNQNLNSLDAFVGLDLGYFNFSNNNIVDATPLLRIIDTGDIEGDNNPISSELCPLNSESTSINYFCSNIVSNN
ncbi:hypothetical protein A9Q84_17050 [Halobacteriovorax marinus]|uniref:Uncharacterized protein n=1 Tax=Halobacteriovorax marinus TaxID=97084 RepID=A0A1Y5F7G9_9BACT|nr:hypothetical protein A9Q84_17050 [Halobacteriovorax marinus]